MLKSNQYAYQSGLGCTDAITATVDDITRQLDDKNNYGTNLIFYDFSKAFDKMQPALLCRKLREFGVPMSLIALVNDYLEDRSQVVCLKAHNIRSEVSPVNVGVPQGTICGPTLWLAFVDSLQFGAGGCVKYADDTTCYYPITKEQTDVLASSKSEVTLMLPAVGQSLVNECRSWSVENHMLLNASKTKTMVVTLKKHVSLGDSLSLDSKTIEKVDSNRFLGVTLDSHLNFAEHVSSVTLSAKRRIYGLVILKRSGVGLQSILHMYVSQIIPALAYAAPSWYPMINQQQIDKIERVQKLALRICMPDKEHYSDRLAAAGIPAMWQRLETLCRDYLGNIVNSSAHRLHSRLPQRQGETRRHSTRLQDRYISHARTNMRGSAILNNRKYL